MTTIKELAALEAFKAETRQVLGQAVSKIEKLEARTSSEISASDSAATSGETSTLESLREELRAAMEPIVEKVKEHDGQRGGGV